MKLVFRDGWILLKLENFNTLFVFLENATTKDKTAHGSGSDLTGAEIISQETCSNPCSAFFQPLTLLQVSINAAVITVSWLVMLSSAIRLLWLRKRSSNVFVRCSALWRFIFFAAVFYLATLAPYVTICLIDVIRGYGRAPQVVEVAEVEANSTAGSGDEALTTQNALTATDAFYLDVSSCFLLIHCAVLPSLYLIRLLGFRRMLSGVWTLGEFGCSKNHLGDVEVNQGCSRKRVKRH